MMKQISGVYPRSTATFASAPWRPRPRSRIPRTDRRAPGLNRTTPAGRPTRAASRGPPNPTRHRRPSREDPSSLEEEDVRSLIPTALLRSLRAMPACPELTNWLDRAARETRIKAMNDSSSEDQLQKHDISESELAPVNISIPSWIGQVEG